MGDIMAHVLATVVVRSFQFSCFQNLKMDFQVRRWPWRVWSRKGGGSVPLCGI